MYVISPVWTTKMPLTLLGQFSFLQNGSHAFVYEVSLLRLEMTYGTVLFLFIEAATCMRNKNVQKGNLKENF